MMTEIPEIEFSELSKLMAKRDASRARPSSLAERRVAEAAAQRPEDGRVRAAATDKKGNVQLNVRVAPDVKNRVIELARATDSDMSGIVEAALLAYFKRKES
jgi:hypothetical protein